MYYENKILFFDITPKGRLLNRFSQDTYTMDVNYLFDTFRCISYMCLSLGYLVIIAVILPYTLLFFAILAPIIILLYIIKKTINLFISNKK